MLIKAITCILLFLMICTTGTTAQRGRAPAQSQQQSITQGCSLSIDVINSGQMQIYSSTGDQFMDNAFIQEINVLKTMTGLNPSFWILDDSGGPNAFANPVPTTPYLPDGRVLFGFNLMRQEWQASGGVNFSIPTILAHECGHIAQFKYGYRLPTMQLELQADYLAGWYMANRNNVIWDQQALADSCRSLFSHGDYDFNNPNHHGTPQQRVNAFLTGYALRGYNLGYALIASANYVTH